MPWTLLFDSPVLEGRMRSWYGHYPPLAGLLRLALERLAGDPDAHTATSSTTSRITGGYHFAFTQEDGLTRNLRIVLFIERHEALRELRVVDGMLRTDPF